MIGKITLSLVLFVGVLLSPAVLPHAAALSQTQSMVSAATTYSLSLSKSSNRSSSVALAGQTVSGNIYAFISPETGIRQVRFYLDNTAASGTPLQTENTAPYDLAGGASTAANPYDSKKLSNGSHSMTAAIDLSAGGTTKITSTFTVSNGSTPTPTKAPTATPTKAPTATPTKAPTATPTKAPTATPGSSYSLSLSKSSNRTSPVALQGQTVRGHIYVFVSPDTGATQVRFYLDNMSASGAPTHTENTAPYDFAGGDYYANPYSTGQLAGGQHTITAAIDLTGGGTTKITSTFTVDNTSPTPTPTATATPKGSIYWGVNIDGVPWDMSKLSSWEQSVAGKGVSVIHWGHSWDENGGYRPWASAPANSARSHGSIPMLSWNPIGGDNTRWQLHRITNGEHDAYVRQFATDVKNWGYPLFIRFGHEMNGDWNYPWQEDSNGNMRGEFVPAWQHVYNIFKSVGATNVSWIWCPNTDWNGSSRPNFASLYPGDSYVDWTCLDGYNWGTVHSGGWETFDQIYNWSYNEVLKVAPSKPMIVGEFGSVEQGGSKANWFTDTLGTQLPNRYPSIRGFAYFNWVDQGADWRVETTTSASAAWKNSIGTSYYYANQFGSITGKIAVP